MKKVENFDNKNMFSTLNWLIKMVRYLLGKESSGGGSIQSIQEGDNIIIDDTDPQNPIISSTGGTPTLAEVLAEGSIADTDIEFIDTNSIGSIGKSNININNNVSLKRTFGDVFLESSPSGLYIMDGTTNFKSLFGQALSQDHFRIETDFPGFKGLRGGSYYGENYDDNTYVQKKYVDDANSYSTSETKTGGTWIDGKPIYRRVIITSQPGGYQEFGNIIIDSEEVELISVAGSAKYQRGSDSLMTYFINSSVPYMAEDSTTIKCFFTASADAGVIGTSTITYYFGLTDEGVFPSDVPFKIILEYTK